MKIINLRKNIIYLVLLTGIILSVCTNFYVQSQSQKGLKNNSEKDLSLSISKIEEEFYFDLISLKELSKQDDFQKEVFKYEYISGFGELDISNKRPEKVSTIIIKTEDNSKQSFNISTNQINNIIKNSKKYGYSFFSLDNVNLYIGFTGSKNNLTLFVFKIKSMFKNLAEYKGFEVQVLDSDGAVIYYEQKVGLENNLQINKEYQRANANFYIKAYMDEIYKNNNYNLLFMVLILIFTLAVATYLFMQNIYLNEFNDKVFLKSEKLRTAYELFRKIAGNSFDMIAIFNEDLKIEYANRSYLKILGYDLDDLKGLSLKDIVTNNFKDRVEYHASRLNSQMKVINFEVELLHVNQKDKITAEIMLEGFFDSEDNITNYTLHCKDITSRRESLKALLKSKRRFKDFANSSADWLWETDKNMRFVFISSGVVNSMGATNDKFIGKKMASLFSSKTLIDDFIEDRQLIKDMEIEVKNKRGDNVYLRISAVPVISESRGFVGYRGVARDITIQKQEQERILELATKDHLTGLLNRSAFMFELEKTIKLSKRNGIKGVLLFIDLDMFKFINDSHGYQAGDKVLLEVSNLLKDKLRETDIISRVGGDEFAVIMHDITSKEARRKIKALLTALNKLKIMYRNDIIHVTCSVGAVSYPRADQSYTQLLTAAGFAMHKAKDLGRNRIYMTEEDYLEDGKLIAKKRMKNLNILRNRLNNNDFEMYFQPIIPLAKGKNVIFESLLRIRDENNNINSPVVYVDAAESFGLSQRLDISVLRKCIKHFRDVQEKHNSHMLSINISGLSLGDDAVYNALKKVVKEEKVDSSKIIIEVTETAAMRDERKARRFVSNLHSLGFKFALDDFGSGYSSFYYLKNLDVDFVKIDGSFIQNLENSKEDRIFVKALSDLARGLGIEIIAEFVENKKHIDILKDLGVDYIQGYYISKPIDGLEEAVVKFDEVTADDI